MSEKSGIEWTDATWNCITGCSKVSQGCKFCYAEREWPRLSAPRDKPNIYTGRAFTDVRCHPEKLDIPLRWTKPRRIFVNSMSDVFHESVPDEFIDQVFDVMEGAKHHVFQVLTKRPVRMKEYVLTRLANKQAYADKFDDCPTEAMRNSPAAKWARNDAARVREHIWLGVSVEDQATADERIPLLLQTPTAVRWVSAEPLLGPIDIAKWTTPTSYRDGAWLGHEDPTLDWLVIGGESGPKARPSHPDWFRSLRDQCQAARVPFFMKQITESGRKLLFETLPKDLQIREYPNA